MTCTYFWGRRFLKSSMEKKRIIATALADFLEVRHHVVSFNAVMNEVDGRVNMPSETYPVVFALK